MQPRQTIKKPKMEVMMRKAEGNIEHTNRHAMIEEDEEEEVEIIEIDETEQTSGSNKTERTQRKNSKWTNKEERNETAANKAIMLTKWTMLSKKLATNKINYIKANLNARKVIDATLVTEED